MSISCVNPGDRDIKRLESQVDASASVIAGLADAGKPVDDALATAKQRYGEALENLRRNSDMFYNLFEMYHSDSEYVSSNGISLNNLGKDKLTDSIIEALENSPEDSNGTLLIQSMIDTGVAPLRFDNNPTLNEVFNNVRKYFIKSALTLKFSPSNVIRRYKENHNEDLREVYFEDINGAFIDNLTDENGDLKLDVDYLAGIANEFSNANNMGIDYFLDVILPRLDSTYKFSFKPAKSLKKGDKRAKYAKTINVSNIAYMSYNKQGAKSNGIIADILDGKKTQHSLPITDKLSIGKLKNSSERDIIKLVDENGHEAYVSLKGGLDIVYRDPSQDYYNVRRILPPTISFDQIEQYSSENVFGYDFIDFNDVSKKILWDSGLTHDEITDLVDYIARSFSEQYREGDDIDAILGINGNIYLSTSKFVKTKKAPFVRKTRTAEVWNNLVRLAKGKIEYMSNIHLLENKDNMDEYAEDEMSSMPKESWMWKAMERDPRTSLSEATRAILNNIPQVTRTREGKYNAIKNSLGEIKYVDANSAHRYLSEHLAGSGSIQNMISRMRRLSNSEPWIGFLLDNYFNNPNSPYDINSFFSDFNKEFLEIMKVSLSNNQAYTLNKRTATEYIMADLKDTLSSSNTHNNRTLWNDKYIISTAKLNAFHDVLEDINSSINESFPKGATVTVEALESWARKNMKQIKRSLDYLGFTLNDSNIIDSFLSGSILSQEDPNVLLSTGHGYVFNRFISALNSAYNSLIKVLDQSKDGNINFDPNNFYNNTLFYPYNELSKIFQYSVNSPIQSSFNNNGKTMYSYMNPSYMSRIMSELCDESLSVEERRNIINKKFGYSFWFSDNDNAGRYYNVFLDMLANPNPGYESEHLLENLRTFSTIKFVNNRDFDELGNLDREIACISAYNDSIIRREKTNNYRDRFAPFMLPSLSDAPNKVMHGINFNFDEIISITKDMIRQEFNRINVIKKIAPQNKKFKVQDYFDRGQHFVNLQALENYKVKGKSFYDALTSAMSVNDSASKEVNINNILEDGAKHVLLDLVQNYVNKAQKIGLFDVVNNAFTNLPKGFISVDELNNIYAADEFNADIFDRRLPRYIMNTWINTRQLMQLFTIDDAFYSGSIDQTKRIKEITAPVQSPAVMNDMQNIVSLRVEDLEGFESDTAASAKALIKKFNAAGLISNDKANKLIKDWESGYNVTDGQTVIGAHTMQNILKAYGNYDATTMDPIFNKLMAGKPLELREQYTFFQTLKPFYFSNEKVTYSTTNKDGEEESYSFPVPTQYKNSEFLVAAVGLVSQNPVLMAFRDIIDANALGARVDKVDFNSTVKHSNFAYITGIKDVLEQHKGESVETIKNAVLDHIKSQVNEGGTDIAQNKYYHSTPFSDYGISNSVPEHFADQTRALGSQVVRHAFSNIPDNVPFNINTVGDTKITQININGKKINLDKPNTLSREQYTQMLSELLAQNLFDDDAKFHETLIDGNDIVQWIYDSAKKSDILTSEQIRALTPVTDEYGNLRPLVSYNSPSHTIKVQQLINSAFKKRVISQGTRGGMLVQTSAFGFTDDLNIRYRDNNGNLIPTYQELKSKNPDMTRQDYDAYVESLGVSSIDYMEAYLPVWSKNMIKDLIDDNGFLDINKKTADGKYIIPESIRNLFAYRIPTEDTYSVVPIRVKGFINNTTGSNIFLPAEITLITGSDFDIDKMFIALYAITKQKDGTYAKMEYDWTKPSYQQSRDARTNAIIDLAYSKYTTPEAALEYVNPSSFEDMKKFAYTHRLTRERVDSYKNLKKRNLSELKSMVKSIDSGRDIYDPIERTLQMGRNNLGGSMIGIFAVNRVFHSSLQNYNAINTTKQMALIDEVNPITGKVRPVFNLSFDRNEPAKKVLGQKYNDNGKLTSYIFGSAVSSATDSVKDPVLEDLNLNQLTAPLFELAVSLGYDEELVYLYLNQPFMLNAVREYQRNPYSTLQQLISNQAYKYYSILTAGEENAVTKSTVEYVIGQDKSVEDVQFYRTNIRDDMEWALGYDETSYMTRANNGQSLSPDAMLEYYQFAFTQLKAANMLLNASKYASVFNEASLTSRPDSRGASVGPNQIDNMQRIKRLQQYNDNSSRLVTNGQLVTLGLRNLRKRDMMTAIINSPFQISQMFTTLGLESMAEIEGRIFSYSSPLYQKAYDILADSIDMDVIPKKLAISLMEDMIAFLSTTNTGFGDSNYELYNHKMISFINYNKFPKDFVDFKKKYVGSTAIATEEDGVNITKNSSFLNALNFYKKSGRIFLNDTMRSSDKFTKEWRDLYYAKVPVSEKYPEGYNPELRDMAMKLYMYNFFYNGMGFGSNTFHKYAPTELPLAIHGYNQLLDKLPSIELDATSEAMAISFIKQFMLKNNTDPRVAEQFNKKKHTEGKDYFILDNGQYIVRISNKPAFEGQVVRSPKQVLRDTESKRVYLMVAKDLASPILDKYAEEFSKIDSDNQRINIYRAASDYWWKYPQLMLYYNTLNPLSLFNEDEAAPVDKDPSLFVDNSEASNIEFADENRPNPQDQFASITEDDYIPNYNDLDNDGGVPKNLSTSEEITDPNELASVLVDAMDVESYDQYAELMNRMDQEAEESYGQQNQYNDSIEFIESNGGYRERTIENANWSDVTIAFAADFNTAGERLTKRAAGNKFVKVSMFFGSQEEPDIFVNSGGEEREAKWILEAIKNQNLPTKNIKLNIAGNGIYAFKQGERNLTQEEFNNYVTNVLRELQKLGITISEIRSGGQTGADEAGIIAAQRLGIKASVNAPKGFTYRDKSGKDISNKESFVARFNTNTNKTLNSIGEIRQKYSETLNTRIRQLCEQYNIPLTALNELDKRLKLNGVMEVQRADSIADMFTVAIRIAKGQQGEAALPEEFAHAIIAMLEGNPLHTRLMNAINIDMIRDILADNYDKYVELYGGDIQMLREEAAGQLLAESFRRVNDNPVKTTILSRLNNLFIRIKDFFRRLFGRMNESDFDHAKAQATNLYNQLAMNVLGGKIQFNNAMVSSANRIRTLYSTTEDAISKKERILRRIIERETEKLEIFKKKKINNASAEFKTSRDLVDALEIDLKRHMYQHGITSFLNTTIKQLKYYTDEMRKYDDAELTENNIRAISRNIRAMKDISSSFNDIIDNIVKEIINVDATDPNWSDINLMIDKVKRGMTDFKILYNMMAHKVFRATLNPLFVNARTVSRGKNKGVKLTDEDIYEKVDRDITGIDLLVDSMANSSNLLLRGVDVFVKQQKEAIRFKVLEHRRKLETLYSRAKNAGIKSFDYMFQRDSKGNLTGNFIMPIDYKKYYDTLKAKKAEWLEKYGDERSIEYRKAQKEWLDNNYNFDAHEPMLDKYANDAYKKLESAKDEQEKLKFQIYKEILDLKFKLDLMLPEEYRHQYRAPQIRRDLIERLKNSSDMKSGLASLGESIADMFVIREDETDYGVANIDSDFSGNEIESLPIYFSEFLKNKNDLSTDIISTMLAYANMAEYFNGFNNVIDLLEVGRDVVAEMKTPKRKGNKEKKTIIKNGKEIVVNKDVLVPAERIIKKYNDFLSSQVYKKFYKDEGTIGNTKISVSKVGNSLISLTAINNLGLNLISGISNVTTGNLQMWTEALAGTIVKNGAPFNLKAVGKADKTYFKALAGFLGDIGARVKQSKLALWDEYFDVMLEFDQDIADANYDRNRFAKMFSSSALFFFNTGGEHWMQNRTSLAMAHSYPMIDNNGNATNLWDAMTVKKEYDSNGNLLTARLVIKDGYRKADGTEFTQKDLSDFKFKTASVNHEMHGIYNKDDQSKMQSMVWGRMVMLFRRWMKPFWNRRWAGLGRDVEYDVETGTYDEGYYVTVGRFIGQAIKEIRAGQFSMTAFTNEMTDQDRANIVKAAFEMLCIAITAGLINFIDWPDKKHSNWGINMTELQVKRLLTEIGCMSPTHLTVTEFLNIVKSPTACADYLERILRIFNFMHYGEEIKSGRYKGHTRGYKYWMDILPMNRTVFKVLNPNEAVKYYNQK